MSRSLQLSTGSAVSNGSCFPSKLNVSYKSSFSTNSFLSTENHILKSIPEDTFSHLLPDLQLVNWNFGQIIYRAEDSVKYVYFPESAVVSIVAATAEGASSEVGMIGSEGIIGIDALLGAEKVLNEHLVTFAGTAFRIEISVIREKFKKAGAFQSAAFNFIRLLMLQISQTALCNRLHSLEARFSRWLLFCDDRAPGNKLTLTHEFLAGMLSVNRPTMSVTASIMKNKGLIEYRRGFIIILDRQGLINAACDCYQKVKDEYDRVQP